MSGQVCVGDLMRQMDLILLVLSVTFIASVLALPREIPLEEVPTPVLQRFRLTYPDAKNVHFKDEHVSPPLRDYEVSFELDGKSRKTMYEYDGQGVVENWSE